MLIPLQFGFTIILFGVRGIFVDQFVIFALYKHCLLYIILIQGYDILGHVEHTFVYTLFFCLIKQCCRPDYNNKLVTIDLITIWEVTLLQLLLLNIPHRFHVVIMQCILDRNLKR